MDCKEKIQRLGRKDEEEYEDKFEDFVKLQENFIDNIFFFIFSLT